MTPAKSTALRFSWLSRRTVLLAVVVTLAGCATLAGGDPPKVNFAGVESLSGEGMELRFGENSTGRPVVAAAVAAARPGRDR